MPKNADWLPTGRQNQLNMAKNWETILNQNDVPALQPQKLTAALWNIPNQAVQELSDNANAAETALTAAQNEETRTKVTNTACKTAFDALTAVMRDIKKRYFYVPPLTEADLVALGLKIPDRTPTQSGTPTGPANKGYRVYYKVVSQGETPPANPGELSKSFFTKRKKDVIDFEFGDSGKTAYFAVQVENNFI